MWCVVRLFPRARFDILCTFFAIRPIDGVCGSITIPPPSCGLMGSLSRLCQSNFVALGMNMRDYFHVNLTWFFRRKANVPLSTLKVDRCEVLRYECSQALPQKKNQVFVCGASTVGKSHLLKPQGLRLYHPLIPSRKGLMVQVRNEYTPPAPKISISSLFRVWGCAPAS